MANQAQSLSPTEVADHAWNLADRIHVCLFTTHDGERYRQRPLSAHVDREGRVIRFLVGASGGHTISEATGHPVPSLLEQIEAHPIVSLGFADPGASDFVSMTGHAEVSNDRTRIHELWSPFMQALWDSPDDPDIRLVTVTPEDAELWEGPSRLVAHAVMLAAAATGTRPTLGQHGSARM